MTSFLTDLLCRYLGKYLDGVTPDTLRLGLWSGVVELTDLRIKKELLDSLVLPIAIKMGYVGKLRIEVPWSRIWSGELKIRIEDVLVILGPVHKDNFDSDAENARLNRIKHKTILGAELYQQAVEETASELSRADLEEADLPIDDRDPALGGESRIEGLLSSIIRNCLIEINRVHVRYEDGESAPERSLALGLTLSSLSIRSSASEEHYTSVFQEFTSKLAQEIAKMVEEKDSVSTTDPTLAMHNFTTLISSNLSAIFKTIRIENLGVYFNSRDVLFLPKRTTQEQLTVQQSMPDTQMSAPIPITIPSESTEADVQGSEKLVEGSRAKMTQPQPPMAPHISESSVERIIRNMTSMIAKQEDDDSKRRNGLQYLVKPFSADVMIKTHARIAKQPVYSEPNLQFIATLQGPITDSKSEKRDILISGDLNKTMDLSSQSSDNPTSKLPSIQIEIDQDQLASFGMMSATLSALAVKRKFAQFRPRVSPRENPRAWWLFIRESLFHDIQQERKKRSMAHIDERRKLRLKYVALYREKILRAWGFDYDPILKPSSLTTSYQDHQPTLAEMKKTQPFSNTNTFLEYQLSSLEDRLEADDIIFFRACSRAQIESEGLVKPPNATPNTSGASSTSLWSRVAPWFGSRGSASDIATKANSDTTKLRNALSKYHFSRLESSEPLQHDEPWVTKLRLAVESSDPNAAWSSSLHSEHAHKIAPKYRHVHPDYAQTSGHISLPSIQLTLFKLEDPVVHTETEEEEEHKARAPRPKDAAPISIRPPSFVPSQYTLMGPQFTITHAERRPLGRLELLGLQIGLEVKPTHRSTSLRVALASLSFADLTSERRGGAQLVKFNPFESAPQSSSEIPNLLDLSLELNPYHAKTGCRFTFDTFVSAKLRRLVLLPNLDFFALLAKTFSKSTSNSFENIMNASKTLEKMKKVTRRHATKRPTRSSLANALLVNASLDLPLIVLTTHSTRAFDEKTEGAGSFPTARLKPSMGPSAGYATGSASTPVLVVDLGSIVVRSTLSFPHEPSLENPQTPFGTVPLHLRERWINSLLISWEGLSATIGDIPFKSDQGAANGTALSNAINSLIASFPSIYSLDQLSKLNRLHSCFRYCGREVSPDASSVSSKSNTRFIILPMMPTRAVVKITSNPLLFVKETQIAMKHHTHHQSTPNSPNTQKRSDSTESLSPLTSLTSLSSPPSSSPPYPLSPSSPSSHVSTFDDIGLQQLSASLSQSKGLAKTEINASIARISLQIDPSSVSLLLRLVMDVRPSKTKAGGQNSFSPSPHPQTIITADTKATPLVVHEGVVKSAFPVAHSASTLAARKREMNRLFNSSAQDLDDDLIDELVAHQVAPSVQSLMFGSSLDLTSTSGRNRRSNVASSKDDLSSHPSPLLSSYSSDLEYDDAHDSDFDEESETPSHFVPQIVVSSQSPDSTPPASKIPLEDSKSNGSAPATPLKNTSSRRNTKLRRWMASNVSLKLLLRGVSILLFAKPPSQSSDMVHAALGISLLDARANISSQADMKNEIKASIGSLLIYHPASSSSEHVVFPFASTVPEGHYYASGWEKKWSSLETSPAKKQATQDQDSSSSDKDWLSACYRDGRQIVLEDEKDVSLALDEDSVYVTRHAAPLLSFGACVYGLPANLFFEEEVPSVPAEVHNGSFWKRASFCASHETYTSNGGERLVSATVDVDNSDAIRPVTMVKAHLGPLVLSPSMPSLTPILSEIIPLYLESVKSATKKGAAKEEAEPQTPTISSPKPKKEKADVRTWLETSPALHVGATWTGLAVVVLHPTRALVPGQAPLLVLSVSRFRMAMDSVAKNKDIQLTASVGSLDLEVDEKIEKLPSHVYPFPLPRSIISVRSFMQPKKSADAKLPFVKTDRSERSERSATASGASPSAKFGPSMASRAYFLSLRLVSRGFSVKEVHRHHKSSKEAGSLKSAVDAVQLQQEVQETKEASNLAREGPWQRKISAKLSRLSIVVSPSLAWKLLEGYQEALPAVAQLKQLIPTKDEKATLKSSAKTSPPASPDSSAPSKPESKQLFSVPKLNVRIELPELLIPLSELSPFEHVSSTQPVHPLLRKGVGRGICLQLGTINATDGYSSGESNFNAPSDASLSSSSASLAEKPEGKSFDLHYMATWRGINASLTYTVFEVSSGLLRRITPLSLAESPYAKDYRLMDAILVQQTPIVVHVAQKGVFHSGPKPLDIPALHGDSLPEFVLNSLKLRVEASIGQLRVRVANHVMHAISLIFQERIEGFIEKLKSQVEQLQMSSASDNAFDLDPLLSSAPLDGNDEKIVSSSSIPAQSTLQSPPAKSPKKPSTPIFLSVRALLISVELYQAVYDVNWNVNASSSFLRPVSVATPSSPSPHNHLYAQIKDVVASVNTPTNPRPCAIIKIASVSFSDVAAIFCKFADQHSAHVQHTVIDVNIGALNALLAAHNALSDSVCKSLISVQSKYISHCLARALRAPVARSSTNAPSSGTVPIQGQKSSTSSARSAESIFQDSEALYSSLPNLSSLVAWSSHTVPGQFPGYVPEHAGIVGTSFLEKAIVLSPPMVQILGQRSLIYSNEYSHESPSYPFVKVHFLTTETSSPNDPSPADPSLSSSNPEEVFHDLEDTSPIIDPSMASSSLSWIHPNILNGDNGDSLSDGSGDFSDASGASNPRDNKALPPPTLHTERQITIEADHLLAVANFESLAYLLRYSDVSLIPSIPQKRSKSSSAKEPKEKDFESPPTSFPPAAPASNTLASSSHTRILTRVSLLSVQIPATSRLPVESKIDSRTGASRSDPPRSVVPSVVLEFGIDAEVSLLDVPKPKADPSKKRKPSIKTSVLLHSLQLYRTAYGQSSAAAGASSAIPRALGAVDSSHMSAASNFAQHAYASAAKTPISMEHFMKSPIMMSTFTGAEGRGKASEGSTNKKTSSYSHSFADIGRLFTHTGSQPSTRSDAPVGEANVGRQWPPSAPGLFGWRSSQNPSSQPSTHANNPSATSSFPFSSLSGHPVIDPTKPGGIFNASQPHLSRLSKVPLLDPVSISANATILPGGSMEASVLAEPLFLKVSNRDALAFLAIFKSALGSPLLPTLKQLKASVASKQSSSSSSVKEAQNKKNSGSASPSSPPTILSPKTSFFKVSLAGVHLLVLEDSAKGSVGVGAETPILNIQLQSVISEIHISANLTETSTDIHARSTVPKLRWKDDLCAVISLELKASYFDARGAFWETLVDPWRVDVHVEKKDLREVELFVEGGKNDFILSLPKPSKQTFKVIHHVSSDVDAWIRAEDRLELTVTAEFLKILQKSKLRWNLSEWRLALESYSPYTKDAHAGAQRSLDFDARKTMRRMTAAGELSLEGDSLDDSQSSSHASAIHSSSPFNASLLTTMNSFSSGTLTPHSLLSSALGSVGSRALGVSNPRTPGGMSLHLHGVTPSQQVVLVNKTGLPLSFSLSSHKSFSDRNSFGGTMSNNMMAPETSSHSSSHPSTSTTSTTSATSTSATSFYNSSSHLGNNKSHHQNLDLGAHSQVLSIDSQTTLDPQDLATLSLQFGAYNAVSGVPIFETASFNNSPSPSSHQSSSNNPSGASTHAHSNGYGIGNGIGSASAAGSIAGSAQGAGFDGSDSQGSSIAPTPITGVRFFQITRSLSRDSDASSSLPSSTMDGDKSSNSFSQSHILVVEYSTIDLSTFITVRGTATFVNDCRSKNVRVGHAKLKSIHEHHLLPAGASWPIPFQWLDEGILNDLLYAHHLAQAEKKLAKRGKRVSTWESELGQVTPPPPSKSQLTIDFQTLTPSMLMSMFTSKGSTMGFSNISSSGSLTPPHPYHSSDRRRSDSSSSHRGELGATTPSVAMPPPFSLSVNYQTSNHEDSHASSTSRRSTSSPDAVGLGSRQMEEMARLLSDFGASSIPLSIHIRPSLVLENLLPVPVDIRVLDRETAKILVQENGVPTSKAVEVFCDSMSHPLLLSIRVPPSTHWSDDYLINTSAVSRSWTGEKTNHSSSSLGSSISRPDSPTGISLGPRTLVHATSDESSDESLAESILVRDDFDPTKPLSSSSIAKTHVLLDYKRPQLYTLHLSLYAAFWIENKSALPLAFAFTDQAEISSSDSNVSKSSKPSEDPSHEDDDEDEISASNDPSSDLTFATSTPNANGNNIASGTTTATPTSSVSGKNFKAPSISSLLPFQVDHKHLGGISNAYLPTGEDQPESEVSTVVDTSLVRPLFASFVSPASQQTGLALFVHWIRRPPHKPSKTDPRMIQDDLEGRNRHWSGSIDLSAFLPASLLLRKPDANSLAAPIHICIPYTQRMSIHLAITIERCTGVFYKSFKLSIAPRLFVSNVSSPCIQSTFTFSTNSDLASLANGDSNSGATSQSPLHHSSSSSSSAHSSTLAPIASPERTAGDPEREIQISISSPPEGATPSAIPVYLLPTRDIRLDDLVVAASLQSTADLSLDSYFDPGALQTASINLNGPQSHLVNMTSSDGVVRGMARLEVARVETSSSSGTLSSYLLAVSTSSQFFTLASLGQPLIGLDPREEAEEGGLASSEGGSGKALGPNNVSSAQQNIGPGLSSLAFQLCPYWVNNHTPYWIKITQSVDPKKKTGVEHQKPNSSLHVPPNATAPFTWDSPESAHCVDIHFWTSLSSSPPETFGILTPSPTSGWLLVRKSVQLDATLLQLPFTLDGLSEEGGKARVKFISLSDVSSQKKSLGTWTPSSKKAVLGAEILVEGPRRHLNLLNLVERDFFSLEQFTNANAAPLPNDLANTKLKPNLNVKAFLGGVGVSVVHSQKRVLNAYQPHKLYTTTSAVEDSAELLYLAIADISADLTISSTKGTAVSAKIESIQLDCPDHAKLNTPNAVILTTMLDDVADSNTGTTDESQHVEDKESSALFLQVRLPPAPSSPSSSGLTSSSSITPLGSKLKKTSSSSNAPSYRDPSSFTCIDYLSLQLRPITICLDQSFVEILLNFANDSLVPLSASSAANVARAAKYKKTGIPANISSPADGLSGGFTPHSSSSVSRGVHLDASQLTYGITSAVAEISPKSVLSSATLAIASTDANRLLSTGLAFYKKPMLIGELVIRPLTLRLTLTTSASVSGTHRQTGYDSTRSSLFDTLNVNRIIRAIGVGTVGVDGLKLRFGSNGVSRSLVTPKELTRMVVKTYLPRAILQALKVFGTLNFTGSPLILVENLAEGMMDVFVDPLHTHSGHGGYFSGAVHGAQNLVIKSIFGLSTSASNASASAAKLLSVLVDSSSSNSSYTSSASSAGSTSHFTSSNTAAGHFGNLHDASRRSSLSSSSEILHSNSSDAYSPDAYPRATWNSIWDEDDDFSYESEDGLVSPLSSRSSPSRPDITYSSSSSIISNALGGYTSTSNGSTGTSSSSESLLASSILTLGTSLVGGATGLVMDPIRGWRRNGASGAIRGFARGVANLALKPSLAVAQILQGTADHLRMPAQRPPPSLLRAPRIPKLAISVPSSSHNQPNALSEDSYSTSFMSIMGQYSSTVQASVSSALNGFGASSSESLNSSNLNGLGSSSSSTAVSSDAASQSAVASVLSYLLASSTASPSRHWDCYDGKSSIGYWLLSKVSREKYNSEFSYRSRYGHVSPLGSYVNHWFHPARGDNACDTYYILTTRCFIKVVPSSSGVPFDASKNRVRQISLLSLSPLDIRYVILLSDVASASFERPPSVGLPMGLSAQGMQPSPRRPTSNHSKNNVRIDPLHRNRNSLDLHQQENTHFVYILLNRPYASSIDANGTELSQFAEEDDEIPKKWFRKVTVASEFEAAQLLQLLPFSVHLPYQSSR